MLNRAAPWLFVHAESSQLSIREVFKDKYIHS